MEENNHSKTIVRTIAGFITGVFLLSGGCMFGWPQYKVWQQNKEGEAELAKAEQNRQIKVQEAKAEEEAAKSLAQAEITRAEGKSKANEILVMHGWKTNEQITREYYGGNYAENKENLKNE